MTIYRFIFQLVMDETKNTFRVIVSVTLVLFWLCFLGVYMRVLLLVVPSFMHTDINFSFSKLILMFLWPVSIIAPIFTISAIDTSRWVDFEWKNHLRSFTFKKKRLVRHHIKYILNPLLPYLEGEYASDIVSHDIAEPPTLDVTNRALIQEILDRHNLFHSRSWIIIVPFVFAIGPILTSFLLLVAYLPMLVISYFSALPIELLVSFVLLVSSILTYYIGIGFTVAFMVRWLVWKNLLFNLDYRTSLQDTLVKINAGHISNFQSIIDKLKSVYEKRTRKLNDHVKELEHLSRLSSLSKEDRESIVWYLERNKLEDDQTKKMENTKQKSFDVKLGFLFWLLGILSSLFGDWLLN